MNIKTIITVSAMILATTGCAVQKNWSTVGGSKSDGTVKMGFTYGAMEIPEMQNDGHEQALKRCQAWGYDDVESFDFVNNKCQQANAYGECLQTMVTKEFQCLDSKENN